MVNVVLSRKGTSREAVGQKCPDCLYCQLCSRSRCRCCRGKVKERASSGLKPGLTYGEYLAWAANRQE